MKKIIVFTAVLFLTAVSVFAQSMNARLEDGISFSAWGKGAFSPLIVYSDAIDANGDAKPDYKFGNLYVGTGSTRQFFGFEQEFSLTGSSDYIGFQFGLAFDGEAVNIETQNKYWYNGLGAAIWVKPLGNDWLKVTGGTFIDETLRGKIGKINDGFEEFVLPGLDFYRSDIAGTGSKDDIFQSFGQQGIAFENNLGFMLSSSPIKGLFIGARVNAPGLWGAAVDSAGNRAEDVYRNIQVGAGYEIPGVGHARIQYLGGYAGKLSLKRTQDYINDANIDYPVGATTPDNLINGVNPSDWHSNPARMEAAFAFTGLENLLVDIGFKAYFPITTSGKLQFPSQDYNLPYLKSSKGFKISAAFDYSLAALNVDIINNFSIKARVDTAFGAYRRLSEDAENLYDSLSDKFTLDARVVPSYNFGFMEIGFDFGYQMRGNEIEADGKPKEPSLAESRWGIGAFVKKGFPNGYIKAGVTYTSPKEYEDKDFKAREAEKLIQIPVILKYSF